SRASRPQIWRNVNGQLLRRTPSAETKACCHQRDQDNRYPQA
ncbi:hypothetical protein PSYJA_44426, partial [Pseudomonas syringae pv. japonica str. M301072]